MLLVDLILLKLQLLLEILSKRVVEASDAFPANFYEAGLFRILSFQLLYHLENGRGVYIVQLLQ